jgi:hypothetical protein
MVLTLGVEKEECSEFRELYTEIREDGERGKSLSAHSVRLIDNFCSTKQVEIQLSLRAPRKIHAEKTQENFCIYLLAF